ncbi:unnamed protein product [Nippostrongylus brasiliensis]|uniref:Centromere/kinetochore protein zw10 homolog n=1 Tax=Nippostrongylus brasiliensis TaxID=27835 RepID=A0A0N4YSN8_NIPBR|nr:unnamed protein product [Nippostrongylus brasiliensis]
MVADLDDLEKDIACGLEVIARGLQERYAEFQPLLKIAEDDIVVKLDELSNKVNENLQLADTFLRENSTNDSSGEDRLLRGKLSDLSNCRQLLDKVQNIEGLLMSCRSNSLEKVNEARNLLECEALLNEITQDDGWPILTGRVRDILRDEVCFMMKTLIDSLCCSFDEFVSYPSTDVKGTVHMHISNEKPDEVSQVVTALNLFGELDKRMKRWAAYIVNHFVQPIIDSENGVDPNERFTVLSGRSEFTASAKVKPMLRGISLEGIVSGLTRLFTNLSSAIQDVELNNGPLSLKLGSFFQEELMSVFLKQCIAASTPVSDSDNSELKNAMETAEKFRNDMINLGFFNEATPTFQAFSEQHFTIFIDRRCLEIIKRAKELICLPYLELAEVGSGEEISEETIIQYREAFGKVMPKSLGAYDSVYPVLLQLPKCTVSKSTVDLLELIFSVLTDAVSTTNEYTNFRPIMSESLWKLRDIAADMLEQVLAEMVYSQTMANIVSFLMDSLCDVILKMEDIRSVDADISAVMLEELLTQLLPIFTINGRSSLHEICSTSYFRTKEIVFCLKGSLQSIDDRWCSAKGPLAQWLQPNEVRTLIKALFMNTEQRRQLLDSIF